MTEFDLARFAQAQDDGGTYRQALAELRRGAKTSHWMWFVFPQLAGLGTSAMAQRYALSGVAEARAYLTDPVLGARLRECAGVVAATEDRTAVQIFGGIDAVKLRSSMTLFARVAPDEPVFTTVIDRFYDGEPDQRTLELLG